MNLRDPLIGCSIQAMALPGVLIDHRLIAEGDEQALLPEEVAAVANSATKVQQASGAVRIVARQLLARLGRPQQAIKKSPSGAPIWPDGIVGSLAHDANFAVAAIGLEQDFSALGVDIEPAAPLEPDLLDLVATGTERERIANALDQGRLLFAIKEAVYKAVYPVSGIFLDHHDIEVDMTTGMAVVCDGRLVHFRYGVTSHIVTLAFIAATPIMRERQGFVRLG